MSEELSFSELSRKRGQPAAPTAETVVDEESQNADSANGFHADEPRYEQGTWKRRRMPWDEDVPPWRRQIGNGEDTVEAAPQPIKVPFDPIRLLDVLKEKWAIWLSAGLLLGAAGFYYGWSRTMASVSAQVMRRDVPNLFNTKETGGDLSKPQQYTEQTLFSMVKAPEILRRVAQKAKPQISPGKLSYSMLVASEPGSELVTLIWKSKSRPQEMVDLINLYVDELVAYSKEVQKQDAVDLQSFLGKQFAAVNRDLEAANQEMSGFAPEEKFVNPDKQTEALLMQNNDLELKYSAAKYELEAEDDKIRALQAEKKQRNPIADKLRAAHERLDTLLVKFTEEHPDVQTVRAEIKNLEQQLQKFEADPNARVTGSAAADTLQIGIMTAEAEKKRLQSLVDNNEKLRKKIQEKLLSLSDKSVHYAMVKNRYQILENMAQSLATKMREAKSFEDSSLGYYKVFSQATTDRVVKKSPFLKSGVFGFAAALAAMFLVCGFLVVKEICDDRLRTAADIERVAKMPVLGTLGDLDKMTPAEQAQWAFRTWTIIKGKLSVSQTDGIVCGFISAHHGEGRSTWIKLLSKTANMRGLRVLTVTTKATNQPAVHPHEAAQAKSEFFEKNGHANEGAIMKTLPSNVLSSPAQVTQELTDPNNNSLPMVHIPIPGWVWNLERRRHWQEAIDAWEKIDNLVLLVELPPANEPESILLAEKLPQVIWLTQSGQVTARETRMHLETLRHANCNLVGAVLNRQPVSFFRNQLGRWFGLFALTASLGLASTQAAEPGQADNTPTTTNVSFSVTSSTPRAEWQKKLTLGPGDVLNLGLYGDTNSFKSEVAVGPDGRISYMQARDILATGLTIDELRQRIDQELSKFYRSPHTLVTPVAFKSKRYVVMGKVVKKGVYPLDRPITVVEALARASGLETGILDRDTLDMADLTRSFLVRQGKRIAINFEKLFQEGDLSQNIQIEPDDYLYFPPTNLKELYVVGEVRTPGVVTYTSDASVAATIAGRGGFTDRAWKSRVLVIRGSLNRPETYVVDMLAIQDARSPDFKLQAKDIIFISSRPFIKAEELLDAAATAFIQSAVTSWAGLNVGPIIRRPIIPNIEHQD